MKFFALCVLVFFSLNQSCFARTYLNHTLEDGRLVFTTRDGQLELVAFGPEAVLVTFRALGEVTRPSHAIVAEPLKNSPPLVATDSGWRWSLGRLEVLIDRDPLRLRYELDGQLLTSESRGFGAGEKSRFSVVLDKDEAIFGGGMRALPLNRRGKKLVLANTPSYGYTAPRDAMYYSLPLVNSSKGYTLLFDNTAKGILDIGAVDKGLMQFEAVGGRKSYLLIAEHSEARRLEIYTRLTGRQPLPPRWALGHIASRFGYRTQRQLEFTVAQFRAHNIPVDAVVLDLFWFGETVKGQMGDLAWDREAWPEPEKMMTEFKQDGVHTVLITEPFILKSSDRWQEAVDAGVLAKNASGEPFVIEEFWFGHAGLVDVFKPEARQWFWSHYRRLTEQGVAGWWGDLGEPEKHPDGLQHVAGPAPLVHNAYGHAWASLVEEGWRRDFSDQRLFLLMRAGFAGSQRYGLMPWSGDVARTWEGLAAQPGLALSMGLQGLAYAHSDLGGFAADADVERDSELYLRWLQFGVFQPIFRPHSQESAPTEPMYWDPKTRDLATRAIEQRYTLLPYIYTLAYENQQRGLPMMRPLRWLEPNNPELWDIDDTYLWGEHLLVAPILASGVTKRRVYFPPGNWSALDSGTLYSGGQWHDVPVAEDQIPTFLRTGRALVRLQKAPLNTKAYSTATLQYDYVYDPNAPAAEDLLYDDDGASPDAPAKGQFELLKVESQANPEQLKLRISRAGGMYPGRPKARQLSFNIRELPEDFAVMSVNGERVTIESEPSGEPLTAHRAGDVLTFTVRHENKPVMIDISGTGVAAQLN